MALKDSLVAVWELNEASGNRADSFGSNTLTDNNTVGSESGKFSQNAAVFVAANTEYLSIADNTALSMGDIDFALAAWVKPASSTVGNVISKWNNSISEREYRLGFKRTTANRFYFEVSNNGSSTAVVSADTFGDCAVDGSTWYWVYCYHDAASNTINISVNNGAFDSTAHSTGVADRTSAFNIGRLASGIQYFDGSVQQASVWKKILTSDDRIAIYNGGTGLSYSGWDAGGGVSVTSGVGAGTGAGNAPTIITGVGPSAGVGAGIGAGAQPSLSIGSIIAAGAGAGTGGGHAPTLNVGGAVLLSAGAGSGAGAGKQPSGAYGHTLTAGIGSGAGTGYPGSLGLGAFVTAGVGSGTGSGKQPSVSTGGATVVRRRSRLFLSGGLFT